MGLSKDEAVTLFHHVILHPKTPGEADDDGEHHLALRYFVEAVKGFVSHVPSSAKDTWQTIMTSVTSGPELYSGHIINEKQAREALTRLKSRSEFHLEFTMLADTDRICHLHHQSPQCMPDGSCIGSRRYLRVFRIVRQQRFCDVNKQWSPTTIPGSIGCDSVRRVRTSRLRGYDVQGSSRPVRR